MIEIREYNYKPEPKEIAEARNAPKKDYSFAHELRVVGIVDTIFENIVETKERLNKINDYGIANKDILSLRKEIFCRTQLGKMLPQLYEQIGNDAYRDEVCRALDNFKSWNKNLIRKLRIGVALLRNNKRNMEGF